MTIILVLLVLFPTLVLCWFTLEVSAGLSRAHSKPTAGADVPRAVIIVPAHDEAEIIDAALESLTTTAAGVAEILLVADNCADGTADLARRHPVRVAERNDLSRRGKGFALAHAQALLAADPPDVVLVIDADCSIDRASLVALVAAAARSGRPCQSINLLRPPTGTRSPVVALSSFAFLIKNLVRQRGLQRLAGCVHLTGTGMSLPWPLFANARLATASIVEDLKLGLDLARQGHGPLLVSDARIWSEPSTSAGTLVQRRRWESGFLSTATRIAPRLMGDALTRGSPRLFALALDLCVPPLALLMLLSLATFVLAVILTLLAHASWVPAILLLVALSAASAALLAAWAREGRGFVSLGELARIPVYILWKIPLYLGLRKPPAEWLRTGR